MLKGYNEVKNEENADELPRVATEILVSMLKGVENAESDDDANSHSDVFIANGTKYKLSENIAKAREILATAETERKAREKDAEAKRKLEALKYAAKFDENLTKVRKEREYLDKIAEARKIFAEGEGDRNLARANEKRKYVDILTKSNEDLKRDREAKLHADNYDAELNANISAQVVKERNDDATLAASVKKEAPHPENDDKAAADRDKAAATTASAIPTTSSSTPSVSASVKSDSDTTDDNDKILKKCGPPDDGDFLVGITKTENKSTASTAKESCIYSNKTTKDIQVKPMK